MKDDPRKQPQEKEEPFPQLHENRIELNYDGHKTVDYALKQVGWRLSAFYADYDIFGVISDGIRAAVVSERNASRKDALIVYVLVAYNHLGKFLLVDRNLLPIYKKCSKFSPVFFQVYDIGNKKIYAFDANCLEGQGYGADANNFIFDTDFATNVESMSAGELLALSKGSDSEYDAYGKKKL